MWLCLNASFGLAKMQFFWTSSSFLSHQRANDSFKKYLFENFLPHSYYISKQLLVQVLFFLFGAKNVIDHHHQHWYAPFHHEGFAKMLEEESCLIKHAMQ